MRNLVWRLRGAAASLDRSLHSRISAKVARKLYGYVQIALGFSIPSSVKFGGDPTFPHGISGVFISSSAEIGPACVIFHQVTIGSNTLITSRGLGAPRIGSRCYLGAGAKIIGGVTIGDDVVVGANAVVTRDVPSNSVVVGNNQVSLRDEPHDTRFFVNSSPWHAVSAAGSSAATAEERMRLDKAFLR